MFCTNCGSPVEDGAHFCSSCGSPLQQPGAISYQPVQQAGQGARGRRGQGQAGERATGTGRARQPKPQDPFQPQIKALKLQLKQMKLYLKQINQEMAITRAQYQEMRPLLFGSLAWHLGKGFEEFRLWKPQQQKQALQNQIMQLEQQLLSLEYQQAQWQAQQQQQNQQ
jgi:hypothetical protein